MNELKSDIDESRKLWSKEIININDEQYASESKLKQSKKSNLQINDNE